MAISRAEKDLRIFDKDFDATSLEDIANIVANEWIVLLRESLAKERATGKPKKPMSNKVATGSLQSSLVPEIKVSPSFLQVEIKGNSYSKFVDKGVSGTKIKYDTPYSFKGKNINQQAVLDFMMNRAIYPPAGTTREQLAFMIGASLAKKGIKPTNYINEAVGSEQIQELKDKLRKAIIDGLK